MADANGRVQATAMAGLGNLLADLGRYDEGRQVLTRALVKAPNDLHDSIMDLVLDAWINLETRAGNTEQVTQWFKRRVQRLEDQSRTRMAEAVRQAELFEAIARERALERQLAEKAVQESQARARQLLLQDLHDGFGSQLAIARLRAARGALPQEKLVSLLDECISDLYLVVDSIDNLQGDVAEALRMFRYRLRGRLEGGATQLHWSLNLDRLPPLGVTRMTHVLRIVQESLANAFRHSHASNIWIEATYGTDASLRIVVRDDGVGLPAEVPAGKGLRGMQARAKALEGSLSVQTGTTGARIELVAPV
jgi:signal transduction histidine kinase